MVLGRTLVRRIWRASVEPALARRVHIAADTERKLDSLKGRLRRLYINDADLSVDGLTERQGARWLQKCGGVILAAPLRRLPKITWHQGADPPTRPLIILGLRSRVSDIVVWGHEPIVFIGPEVQMVGCNIACGRGSTVVIGKKVTSAPGARVNARNGGTVYIEGDGLWAPGVKLYTDDMHAIRDVQTGARVNAFGGTVKVEHHVWLGEEAMLLHGAHVRHNTIVGARAVVTKELPANSVCVGSPARSVRQNVTWTFRDDP